MQSAVLACAAGVRLHFWEVNSPLQKNADKGTFWKAHSAVLTERKLVVRLGNIVLELFPHNQRAYDMVCRFLESVGKAAVIHPTGTGKSFIAFRLVMDNPQAAVLWLSPSEYIFRTQVENFKKSLSGLGQEREMSLGQMEAQLEFMTYSRLMRCPGSFSGKRLDYIILDEFHRCGATEWGKGVQKLLLEYPKAKVLGLSATNVRYLDGQRDMAEEIFHGCIASKMTLGEAVAENILPAPLYVVSMYSYQKELERLKERVKNGRDFSIRKQNEELLEKLRRSLEHADGLEKVFARHMENRRGKYIVFCSGKHHMEEMVSHAGEWFCLVDRKPHIYQVTHDASDAGKQFEAFQEDGSCHLKLLFCIDMLNEGVHVDGVDGVILLRPTVSPALYLQQIGRGLAAGKEKRGQPVIFDIVNNFESLSSIDSLQGEFEQALALAGDAGERKAGCQGCFRVIDELLDCRKLFRAICRNLSSPWDAYYREAEAFYKREGHLEVKKRYVTESGLNLGSWVLTQRRVRAGTVAGNLSETRIKRLDAIGMRWEDKKIRQFEEGLAALTAFTAENGNGDAGSKYVAGDGFPLGKWLGNMRTKYKNGCLEGEAVKKLEKAGMVWDAGAYRWEMYFQAAEEYKGSYGNLEIPAGYITEDGKKLGVWLNNQKSCYRKKYGKSLTGTGSECAETAPVPKNGGEQGLTKEQVQKLESLGICWEGKAESSFESRTGMALEKKDSWEYRCQLAGEYFKKYGNLEISQQYVTQDGIWLGKWLYIQRMQYKKGVLEDWKKEKLEEVGICWKSAGELAFDKGCRALEEYSARYPGAGVPKSYAMPDGYRLGGWVCRQRKKKKDGKLTGEQAERLRRLGCV